MSPSFTPHVHVLRGEKTPHYGSIINLHFLGTFLCVQKWNFQILKMKPKAKAWKSFANRCSFTHPPHIMASAPRSPPPPLVGQHGIIYVPPHYLHFPSRSSSTYMSGELGVSIHLAPRRSLQFHLYDLHLPHASIQGRELMGLAEWGGYHLTDPQLGSLGLVFLIVFFFFLYYSLFTHSPGHLSISVVITYDMYELHPVNWHSGVRESILSFMWWFWSDSIWARILDPSGPPRKMNVSGKSNGPNDDKWAYLSLWAHV